MDLLRRCTSQSSIRLAQRYYRRSRMPPEFLGKYINKITDEQLKQYRTSEITDQPTRDPVQIWETEDAEVLPERLKGLYQELVPAVTEFEFRDRLKEMLERKEMMRRRKHFPIPEFYVGSVLAATISDQNSPDRTHRFVGICIERNNCALWTNFTLRNVIDSQPVEIKYDLYNPTFLKLEVLKLERRLDENLWYLRDAPREYSTFPFNMNAIPLAKNQPVPVNRTKVPLLSPPWIIQWQLHGYLGIDEESLYSHLTPKQLAEVQNKVVHADRYDLMKSYRERIPEAQQETVYRDVFIQHQDLIKYQEQIKKKKVEEFRRSRK